MVAKGALPGPDITTCGRILNSSNFDPEPFQPVHSEEEIRREIRWQKAAGVDCIKVYSSMTPDFVRVAVDEAHKNGLPVIGHLQRTTWTEAKSIFGWCRRPVLHATHYFFPVSSIMIFAFSNRRIPRTPSG